MIELLGNKELQVLLHNGMQKVDLKVLTYSDHRSTIPAVPVLRSLRSFRFIQHRGRINCAASELIASLFLLFQSFKAILIT